MVRSYHGRAWNALLLLQTTEAAVVGVSGVYVCADATAVGIKAMGILGDVLNPRKRDPESIYYTVSITAVFVFVLVLQMFLPCPHQHVGHSHILVGAQLIGQEANRGCFDRTLFH